VLISPYTPVSGIIAPALFVLADRASEAGARMAAPASPFVSSPAPVLGITERGNAGVKRGPDICGPSLLVIGYR
jgi:alpha-D-ribose 1-methylphosphonate 5-triphosphate diphosphatase PhnM